MSVFVLRSLPFAYLSSPAVSWRCSLAVARFSSVLCMPPTVQHTRDFERSLATKKTAQPVPRTRERLRESHRHWRMDQCHHGNSVGSQPPLAGGLVGLFGTLLSPLGLLASGVATLGFAFKEALAGEHGAQMLSTLSDIWTLTKEVGANLMEVFRGVISYLQTTWVGFFGGELPKVMASPFQAVLEWIREVADWASLLTTDFRLSWELIKEAGLLAWVSIKDYLIASLDSMRAHFVATYESWVAGMAGVVLYFWSAFNEIKNIALAVWEGIKAAWAEGITGDPTKAFKDAFVKTLASQKDEEIPGIGEMARSAYDRTYKAWIDPSKHGESKESKDIKAGTRERIEGIKGEMHEKRDRNRGKRKADDAIEEYFDFRDRGIVDEAIEEYFDFRDRGAITKKDDDEKSPLQGPTSKGQQPVFQGLVEFSKSIQSGLMKSEAEKALAVAEKTAANTAQAAANLNKIATEGVKLKDPQPAVVS